MSNLLQKYKNKVEIREKEYHESQSLIVNDIVAQHKIELQKSWPFDFPYSHVYIDNFDNPSTTECLVNVFGADVSYNHTSQRIKFLNNYYSCRNQDAFINAVHALKERKEMNLVKLFVGVLTFALFCWFMVLIYYNPPIAWIGFWIFCAVIPFGDLIRRVHSHINKWYRYE